MGQPSTRDPVDGFAYLYHHIDNNRRWIYLWIIEDATYPVTVKIPYTEPMHQQLIRAEQMKGQGVAVQGTITEPNNHTNGTIMFSSEEPFANSHELKEDL